MDEILTLKPVEDNDIQQLEFWLHKEHILKWYHDAGEWLNEIKERNGCFHCLNHFIVLKGGNPIGSAQWYDCFDAQEEWYSINQSNTKPLAWIILLRRKIIYKKAMGKRS